MTDRDRWDLRGPVHTCRLERTWYLRSGADAEPEERGDAIVAQFRPDGALVHRRHFNQDGSEWSSTSEYDAAGRLVLVRSGKAGDPVSLRLHEYDSRGRLIRVIDRSANGRDRLAEAYEYDAARLTKKTQYVDAAALSGSASLGWAADGNAEGRPAELELHDSNGRALGRVEFTYDDDGRLVSERHTRLEGMLSEDGLDEMTPAAAAATRALLAAAPTQQHRYDDRGRLIETVLSMFGPLGQNRRTMAYNDHDDKIEEVSEDVHRPCTIEDDGRLTENPEGATVHRSEARFRYEYDAHGNWLTKVVEGRSTGGEFVVSTRERRTLTYF